MIYPVRKIKITCIGAEADLDQLIHYWYGFAGTKLRFGDDFAHSSIERGPEKVTIMVNCIADISLYSFDDLANKFPNLTFKLIADRDFFDHHILVYQNGVKTIHINKYYHFERLSQNNKKWTTYISDHINKITRIEREEIKCTETYKIKKAYIVYDEFFTDYIKREEEYLEDDRINY